MGDHEHKHEGDAGSFPSEELARALVAGFAEWCGKPVLVQFRSAVIPAIQQMEQSSIKDAHGNPQLTPVVVKTDSGARYSACMPMSTKEGPVGLPAAAGSLEPEKGGTRLVFRYSLGAEAGQARLRLHPAQIEYVQLVEAPPPPVPLVLKT